MPTDDPMHDAREREAFANEMQLVNEYEAAAEWAARCGLIWKSGDPLPSGTSAACREQIEIDPESFLDRARDYAYAAAMANIKQEEE